MTKNQEEKTDNRDRFRRNSENFQIGHFKISKLILLGNKSNVREPQKSSTSLGKTSVYLLNSFFYHFD